MLALGHPHSVIGMNERAVSDHRTHHDDILVDGMVDSCICPQGKRSCLRIISKIDCGAWGDVNIGVLEPPKKLLFLAGNQGMSFLDKRDTTMPGQHDRGDHQTDEDGDPPT